MDGTLRMINHATLDPTALGPIEVYRVLGDLVSLLQRLPQTIDQLDRTVARWHNVRTDRPTSPIVEVAELRTALTLSSNRVAAVTTEVSKAHQAASHLYIGVGP